MACKFQKHIRYQEKKNKAHGKIFRQQGKKLDRTQWTHGQVYEVTSIFKPNAPHTNVIENLREASCRPYQARSYCYSGGSK